MVLFDSDTSYYSCVLSGYESVDRYIEWLLGDFPFCMHANDPEMLRTIRKSVEPGSYKEYGLVDVPDKYLDQAIIFVVLMKYYKVPCTYPLPKNAVEVFNRILEDRFYFSLLEEQIPEYCVLAMARFAANFRYVKNQLPELCLLAVESDPTNLREVREQTFKICLAAVKANGDGVQKILQFIRDSEMRERVKLVINSREVEQLNDEEDLAKTLSGLPGLMAGGLFGALGDVISSAIKQLDSETTQNLMKAQSELAAALREQKEILKQWQDAAGDWATVLSEKIDVNNRIAEVAKKGNGSNLLSPEFASLREKTEEAEHRINTAASNYSEIAAKAGEQHKKVEKAVQKFKEAEAESNEEDIKTVTNSLNRSRASLMNDAGTSSMNVSWESLMNDACNENSLERMGNIKLF